MDKSQIDKAKHWPELSKLDYGSSHAQWVSALAAGLNRQLAPWVKGAQSPGEGLMLTRLDRVAAERRVVQMVLWALGEAKDSGHWSAAVEGFGIASGMPLVIGRAEVGRVAMRWASEGETKKWGSRFESLAGSSFFDSSSPWAQAERVLKEDSWPLARGRDEDAGGEMARMLLARAASAEDFSAASMGKLARARMEALSMFAGEYYWIGAGADMVKAVGKRFLSSKKLGQSEFDAYPELAWLGARSASGHDSALGAWVGEKLQKAAQESENCRDKLAAVDILRFDQEALSRFDAAFPGVLESRAAYGASMLFGDVQDRLGQFYRVDSALGRPSGKWARSAFGVGGELSDGELDKSWARLIKAIPAVCALWQATELKKAAGKAKKAGNKKTASL